MGVEGEGDLVGEGEEVGGGEVGCGVAEMLEGEEVVFEGLEGGVVDGYIFFKK